MAEPIRILHVLGTTNLGGAESRIMDLYRHIDRNRIQFDFLVHSNSVHSNSVETDEEGYFDKEIKELGGRIFRVPRFRIYNYFFYRAAFREFFKKHNEFKMVQGHITSSAAIYLPIAKKAGIETTIAHARSAGVDKGLKGLLTRWMRRNLSEKTDYMFTCSKLAGISVFGNNAVEEGKTIFIPNAIDCPAFTYNEWTREKIRKELGLMDKYVIGHVGRFHYAKNHEYLLRVFAELSAGSDQYVLILLGEGGGMEKAKALSKELGIESKIYFLGNRGNVYDYYQAMDYFVYPSRFEGLPGTVVEAQTSGLRCLISDSICNEVSVTDLVHTMSIEEEPKKWAEYIEKTKDYERKSPMEEMQKAGFDVSAQAELMMKFYESGKWEK
ncbi:MAG: glycosyltransferase family 1 protein [Suilimivivens sp.]